MGDFQIEPLALMDTRYVNRTPLYDPIRSVPVPKVARRLLSKRENRCML